MFSLVQRGQQLSNHAVTVMLVLCGAIAASFVGQLLARDAFALPSVMGAIEPLASLRFSHSAGATSKKGKENAKVKFDLSADLTPLFTWNTKQVFVYVTATYPGKSPDSSNVVTVWDRILTNRNQAQLQLKGQKGKYGVWDVEHGFRNRNATLELNWNIQPWVGPMVNGKLVGGKEFTFASVEK